MEEADIFLFFLCLQLIYQSGGLIFQDSRGVQNFPGVGGGGLGWGRPIIPMETYRICEFPVGVQTPVPPSLPPTPHPPLRIHT